MWIIRYVVSLVVTMWLVITGVFFVLRILPGDAITAQLSQAGATIQEIEQRRQALGIDQPIIIQYVHYLKQIIQGDFGVSLYSGQPVFELVAQRMRVTMILASCSLVLAVILGFIMGVIIESGYRISSIIYQIVNIASGMPVYWTGTIILFVVAPYFRNLRSAFDGFLLPILLLGFHTSLPVTRLIYTNIRETKSAPFIQVAYAKGLHERTIYWKHILRVGLLPVIASIALQAGFLFGGTVVMESIFSRAGLGLLLLDATLTQDYPVVQGGIIVMTFFYVSFNTIAEVLYSIVDPRISH